MKWGDNKQLSIWALRLKTLVLLSLTVMLRPSDVAPRSEKWNESQNVFTGNVFKRSWLDFSDRKYLKVYLFGIKNDYNRDGFCVNVPYAKECNICPVLALKEYVQRTSRHVASNGPVFISLNRPYVPLSAGGVASVLNKAIELVGLHNQGFSAKCFRPTGATVAIEKGLTPDAVQSMGRWRNTETFRKHYVHAKPTVTFTDCVLQQ